MSIDIEVIPTVDMENSWDKLKQLIVAFSPAETKSAMATLQLLDATTRKPLRDTEAVRHDRGYFLGAGFASTLSMCFIDKDPADDDEAYIEDMGKQMSHIERNDLFLKWRRIPYSILISSGALRNADEACAIGPIAAGIAAAWEGYIAVTDAALSVDKGIYSPEAFAGAKILSLVDVRKRSERDS